MNESVRDGLCLVTGLFVFLFLFFFFKGEGCEVAGFPSASDAAVGSFPLH